MIEYAPCRRLVIDRAVQPNTEMETANEREDHDGSETHRQPIKRRTWPFSLKFKTDREQELFSSLHVLVKVIEL